MSFHLPWSLPPSTPDRLLQGRVFLYRSYYINTQPNARYRTYFSMLIKWMNVCRHEWMRKYYSFKKILLKTHLLREALHQQPDILIIPLLWHSSIIWFMNPVLPSVDLFNLGVFPEAAWYSGCNTGLGIRRPGFSFWLSCWLLLCNFGKVN